MYCVYLTTYKGTRLPKYYIGSTSIDKIKNGYKGSVSSKEWKSIWDLEVKEYPDLFEVLVISIHNTRKEALEAELEYQISANVVESKDYVNKSLAQPDGFFGMDVSGENNPMYGKSRTGEKHKGGENIAAGLQKFFASDFSQNHRNTSRKRLKQNNPMSNPDIKQKVKDTWKKNGRGLGPKNGMYGKQNPMAGKILYNDGKQTKAFYENQQPEGWVRGRHKVVYI